MTHDQDDQAAKGGRRMPEAPPAAAGGLDLSLGHIGTSPATARPGGRYLASCAGCHLTMSEEVYQVAEDLEGLDPRCPGCGRSAWLFESAE